MASSKLPQTKSLDAYAVNETLTLGVRSEYVTDFPPTIQVRIRQLHTRTLSCTITVDILDGNQPLSSENPVFLKLFESKEGKTKQYRVFMIDFALCRIRGRDESDLEWGRAKSTLGEDSAVTARMDTLLKKYDFSLQYEISTRWDEGADTDTTVPDYFVTTVLREGVVVSRTHPKYVGNGERVGASQLP